jgi:hypothetical protein
MPAAKNVPADEGKNEGTDRRHLGNSQRVSTDTERADPPHVDVCAVDTRPSAADR